MGLKKNDMVETPVVVWDLPRDRNRNQDIDLFGILGESRNSAQSRPAILQVQS